MYDAYQRDGTLSRVQPRRHRQRRAVSVDLEGCSNANQNYGHHCGFPTLVEALQKELIAGSIALAVSPAS